MRMIRLACIVAGFAFTTASAFAQQTTPAAPMVGKTPLAEWLAKWRSLPTDERAALLSQLQTGPNELPNREACLKIAELVTAPDTATREVACDLLMYDHEDAQAVMPPLAAATKDAEPRVRLAAARALSGIAWMEEQHGPNFKLAMDELIALASGKEAELRLAAASVLTGNGRVEPRLVALFTGFIKESDVEMRRLAALGLGTALGKYDDARPPLHEALNDTDATVRLYAARALTSEGENTDELAGVLFGLASDQDKMVRSEAIGCFASLGFERAAETLPILINALGDGDPLVRAQAAGALGNLGSGDSVDAPDAAPRLVELTKDADPVVRGAAAWALGHVGASADAVAPALASLIQNPNAETRQYALTSLKETEANVVLTLPQLIAALDDGEPSTRKNVAQLIALGGPKSQAAVDALTRRLSDPNLPVRIWSAYALREIGDAAAPATTKLVKALADDPEPKMRVEAARTLAAIGPLAGVAADALIAAMRDPEADVRLCSLFALGEIGVKGDAVLATLREATKSTDGRVLAEANKALAKLGAEHDESAIKNAPVPAPRQEIVPISTPLSYDDVVLVLSDSTGAAVFHFLDDFVVVEDGVERRGVHFEFRYLAHQQDEATNGTGEVVDLRKVRRTEIHASPLNVDWSDRGKRSGWIYWQPEQVHVETVGALDYESLDLKRFVR